MTLHSLKFRTGVGWMRKYNIAGVVIWPRVMFGLPGNELPRWLFRHEMQHVYQIIREGPWKFYLKYFLYSLRYGYNDNPFEVEARKHQLDPLTEAEEILLCKLNEGSTSSPSDLPLRSRL